MSFWETVIAVVFGGVILALAPFVIALLAGLAYNAWYFVFCEWPDSFMHKFKLGRWKDAPVSSRETEKEHD